MTFIGLLILAILASPPETSRGEMVVYFSPHGGCTDAIVAELAGARYSIRVQAFVFTSRPILDALNEATKRRVDVAVILDGGQARSRTSLGPALKSPVTYDFMHGIAHNKIIIVDDKSVITGSFNFTAAAEEHNAENLLIVHSIGLSEKYRANWDLHRKHSRGRDAAPEPPP